MITILFIAIASLAVPFFTPTLLHSEEELSQFSNNKDKFKKLYWKDSLKLFSFATLAYLVLSISILQNTKSENIHKVVLSAIVLIMVWSIGYIYSHTKR